MSKPVNLVLGSGGAKGLAHIGVIHELLAQDYRICSVTGCSMGALVGGFYVAGELDNYEKWVRQLTRWDVLRFMDITMGSFNGVMKGDRIMEKLSEWIGDIQIEDLEIPFTAVAADIISRKEVWIRNGSLVDAIRASVSMPGLFTPQRLKNRILVDGGILNPLPVPPATIDSDIKTVAVSLAGSNVHNPFGKEIELSKTGADWQRWQPQTDRGFSRKPLQKIRFRAQGQGRQDSLDDGCHARHVRHHAGHLGAPPPGQ